MPRSTRRVRGLLAAATAAGLTVGLGAGVPAQAQEPAAAQQPRAQGPPADRPDAPPTKSIGFFVGKNLTESGSTLLGGFGHEPSSHWLEIVPRRTFPEGATTTVGITDEASMPGERTEIPQARETARYITSNYSEFAGFPAPLTNGGLNEHGVAARDIWSPTRDRLLDMTEEPQTGPNYSDLSRIAMERATSAREAVQILGGLIDEHGYSSYGGNSHMFADEDEGWVFVDYGGNQGLWAAERLGPDDVRVSFPGYLNPFPLDWKDHPDRYLASDHLVDFAEEQGWWDRQGKDAFDVQGVYGALQPNEVDRTPTHPVSVNDQGAKERELREDLAPVSLRDMMAYVRDPRWSHDRSGYGQVAELREQEHRELHTLWTAVTGSVATPYVPLHIGADDVPPEFKQHRYMTHDSASTYLAKDYAPLEATRYATRTFKRLMYHTCENPETFLKPVTAELEAYEDDLLTGQEKVRRKADRLLDRGRDEKAHALLTRDVERNLLGGLALGEDLVDEVEERTRDRFGIRLPTGRENPGETWRPESQSMARGGLPGDADDIVYCYREGIDEYPREHGSYEHLAGDLVKNGRGPADTKALGITTATGPLLFALGLALGLLTRRRRPRTQG